MHSIEEAEQLARELMRDGERIPERCAVALTATPPPDAGRAERLLELLGRLAPPPRLLPLLDRIMLSKTPRIRSKAWKLYAGASADLDWAFRQLGDPDTRVAANVIEALWRAEPSDKLRELFYTEAHDDRNRVAGNGLVGLLLAGDPRAPQMAEGMANHAEARFRASAAWALGRGQWTDAIVLLSDLRRDRVEKVRIRAERSLLHLSRG